MGAIYQADNVPLRRQKAVALLLLASLLLAGCTVGLVARNDPQTESMTTALQTLVDAHFAALGQQTAPACFHDGHLAFYAQEQADVSALEQRVTHLPKNDPTIDQVHALQQSLQDVETLHKLASGRGRCLTAPELRPAQSGIDTTLASILELERRKPPAAGAPR